MNEGCGRQNEGEQSFHDLERHRLWSALGVTRGDRMDNSVNQGGLVAALSGTALSTIGTAR